MLRTFAVILVFVFVAHAQRVRTGGCPNLRVMPSLDVKQYVGEWYEIEKNPVPFETGLKCNKAVYGDQGDFISVVNSGVRRSGAVESIEGKATIPDKNVTSKLKVKFNNLPFQADYWVLDTDYEKYSVVYSCFSIWNFIKAEYLWILSRTPTMEEADLQKVYQLIDDQKINRSNLRKTDQSCHQ